MPSLERENKSLFAKQLYLCSGMLGKIWFYDEATQLSAKVQAGGLEQVGVQAVNH